MFEAQYKFEVKIECDDLLAMNHLQFMVIHKSNDFLFMLLYRWKPCPILAIPNIFKGFCIWNLASSNKIGKIFIPL
jgi:hypothetical protein